MGKLAGPGAVAAAPPVDLLQVMQAVQDRLSAAGIRCVLDSRDLPIPGAYLAPPILHARFGKGLAADHRLVLVASNTDRERALTEMSDLIAAVQAALDWAPVTFTPTEVETADQTAFLVAYELTWTDRKELT
jgi:hypothetical protein